MGKFFFVQFFRRYVMSRIDTIIELAEASVISTTPGAVPPHVDDGGHLPFGGTIGNTRGPSAFGKRKLTTANTLGNPQSLLLNYPPEPTKANLDCWMRNCVPHSTCYPPSFAQIPADNNATLKHSDPKPMLTAHRSASTMHEMHDFGTSQAPPIPEAPEPSS